MTEAELRIENDKLNARLQKAIEVFAEQKKNIQRLTDDNAALKARIDELEAKAAAVSENDDKFFEQLQEIDSLKSTIAKTNDECADKILNLNQTIEKLTNANELYEGEVNKLNESYSNAQAELDEKNVALDKARTMFAQQKAQIAEFATKEQEYTEIITRLNEDAQSNVDTINDLTARVSNLEAALENSQNLLADTQAKLDATSANAQTKIAKAKETVKQMQQLGSDLITNFDMFA